MAEAITQDMPVGELLAKLVPSGTATHLAVHADKIPLVAEASPAAGGLFSWQNPLGVKVLAMLIVNVRTPATGSATADCGVTSDATTSVDTLLDALDIGAAAIVGCSFDDTHSGTNGLAAREVDENGGTNDWITGTASGDSSGIVGEAIVIYVPIDV